MEQRNFSTVELVEYLLGGLIAWGETNHDAEILHNLDEAESVLQDIVQTIGQNIGYRSRQEASLNEAGAKATQILADLRDQIARIID